MKNRRALGLCRQAGCKVNSGDSVHCEFHALAHSVTNILSQQKRRAKGVK